MTLRNLMTSLLALTLMVCVVGCDSDTDSYDETDYTEVDVDPVSGGVMAHFYADDGSMIILFARAHLSPWYECYRAGFCSKAARWFGRMGGGVGVRIRTAESATGGALTLTRPFLFLNKYKWDKTPVDSGCGGSEISRYDWHNGEFGPLWLPHGFYSFLVHAMCR